MSVNLNGKQGNNIDMDEYVETYMVRPLKTNASGTIKLIIIQVINAKIAIAGNMHLFRIKRH